MEVGGAAADLKLPPAPEAPVPTDASKRVIYQDKMADQDAPQRQAHVNLAHGHLVSPSNQDFACSRKAALSVLLVTVLVGTGSTGAYATAFNAC